MIHYLIFDTETTGLPKKNDFSLINMIELGYIILDEDFKIVKESNNLVKCDFEIPEIILLSSYFYFYTEYFTFWFLLCFKIQTDMSSGHFQYWHRL
jgi:hypothetical protein